MTPAERDRFEKCLALANRGATAGEREAARAAAERIAAGAGLTLTEAAASLRNPRFSAAEPEPPRRPPPSSPRRPFAWAQPKEPVKPITVEELRRQKAETEAWKKRAAASAELKRKRERAEQEAYAAEQRAAQAERDREWAAAQARRKAP
ncbi:MULTISPECIES: hypothetical protein [Methylobacterium]|uniref:hypothetical protein n=1 Tax=Methylobacterium TaxID=407 RepID=UPI00026983B3|nr:MULTISPECIES: hypothetical protein [Methylobacterium]EIZ82350.1 hypothetical protein WYO_4989 [Methylobacterium sp. GXF4]MDH2308729.1 hypothetical protein [Methylobacterium brachiatum]